MLEASRRMETKVKTATSVPVPINAIYEEVMKAEVGRAMTLDDLRDYLLALECQRVADDSYSIDLKNILELAQSEEVKSIVSQRYDEKCYRIFRLLLGAGHFRETDKIADTAFVDKKEAPKILNNLWKEKYLYSEVRGVIEEYQGYFCSLSRKDGGDRSLANLKHLWMNLADAYHMAGDYRSSCKCKFDFSISMDIILI